MNDEIKDSKERYEDEFLADDKWLDVKIEENMLNLDDELVTPEYTIRLNGARVAPVTGVQTIAGQSGAGKTQLMTLLMSVYLGAKVDGIELIWKRKAPRVLYIDTEMEKGNTQLVVERVARLCNCKASALKDRLTVIRLRDEDNHAVIWQKVLKAVWQCKPDVLFLDGMIDIIGDFNDNKEASSIIRKVMMVADHYGMPIWTVMHQNPGTNKMAGHQGSFLERKSTIVAVPYKICDNEELGIYHFEVKSGKQRGEDLKPLLFKMVKFTLPNGDTNAYPVTFKKEAPNDNDLKRTFESFMPAMGCNTRDLRRKVAEVFRCNETHATDIINDAVDVGVLACDEEWTKDGTKLKSRHYTLNSDCPF